MPISAAFLIFTMTLQVILPNFIEMDMGGSENLSILPEINYTAQKVGERGIQVQNQLKSKFLRSTLI